MSVALLALAGQAQWLSLRVVLTAALGMAMVLLYRQPALRSLGFAMVVLVCVWVGAWFPDYWLRWGSFSLSASIVPLVQVIMFGMGTTLSVADFGRVLQRPLPAVLGVLLQFMVMPFLGWCLTLVLPIAPELAVGIVLVGSVSGGVASNVMAYLARANVALSVSMTCVSTLVAPLATPLLLQWYADVLVPIDVPAMMLSIVNMILVPVGAGLWAHHLLQGKGWPANRPGTLWMLAVALLLLGVLLVLYTPATLPLRSGMLTGCGLLAAVCVVRACLLMWGRGAQGPALVARGLPYVSMAGIAAIVLVIVAQTQHLLLQAGGWLVLAAVVHNSSGYLLGYWIVRAAGWCQQRWGAAGHHAISEADCRTVAFEVGMQNGGMATGLALEVLHSTAAALPPNLFGAWMNMSGSLLANWWRRNGPDEEVPPMP